MPRPKNFSTRYYSDRQEKKVARAVKGRKTPNSGSTPYVKGDVLNELFLLECKTHMSPTNKFTIRKEWIDKNREEAFQMGRKYDAIVIDFGDGENHYLINQKLFLKLLEYLRGEEKNG